MRLFFGVDIPPLSLRAPGRPPEHLTVRFLGERSAAEVDALAEAVGSAVAGLPPFPALLSGLGAFPSLTHPQVLWQGLARGREEWERLVRAVSEALRQLGVPDDPRSSVPHATILRVRSSRDLDRLRTLLQRGVPDRSFRVEEVRLKESVRGPGGREHRVLRRLFLRGGLGSEADIPK